MASTTVTGRVRATVRLKDGDGGDARVIATSWASDRTSPRTRGAGVTFEVQTEDGLVMRVEPFEALVILPVRQRTRDEGARHERAWIAIDDEIAVEGELDAGDAAHDPRASHRAAGTRRGGPAAASAGALERGAAEEIAAPTAAITPEAPEPTPDSTSGEAAPESSDAASEAAVVRRPKKKRPDPSGTPTPIQ